MLVKKEKETQNTAFGNILTGGNSSRVWKTERMEYVKDLTMYMSLYYLSKKCENFYPYPYL